MKTFSKIIKISFACIMSLIIISCIIFGCYFAKIAKNAEKIDTENIYDNMNQTSIIYDKNGKEIDTLFLNGENRTIIPVEEMPKDLLNAVVSIEDKTFWKHHGFNIKRMIGAIYYALRGGRDVSGTSTLTQQLARNVYLPETRFERSVERKLTEAYYASIIERNMSKKEILEAYLNTVYFGYGSYGIEQAAQNYFGKHAKDLNTFECVALAAMPQSPSAYAMVFTDSDKTEGYDEIAEKQGIHYIYNGDASAGRRATIINNMYEFGYISANEKEKLLKKDLKDELDIKYKKNNTKNNYFLDYAISQVKEDLMAEYDINEEEADRMIYQGGLKIYTTLDQNKQKILQKEIDNASNYTSLQNVRYDYDGNIINEDGDIILFDKDDIVNNKEQIVIKKSSFKKDKEGDIIIKNRGYININEKTVQISSMYEQDENGDICIINGGQLIIPEEYISKTKKGNLKISKKFFEANPKDVKIKKSKITFNENMYALEASIRQPQAACAIIENKSGNIIAMSGGSGVDSRSTYNRATSPHQTGSSIKPLSVYTPALQKSVDYMNKNREMSFNESRGDSWGEYLTAGSIINDAKMITEGKVWPQNVTRSYSGRVTMRTAVKQSINTCAVKVLEEVGLDYSLKKLKENGITSLIEEGNVNDKNLAALALGGQSTGVSPLEMSAAYRTLATDGNYIKPKAYRKVINRSGKTLLKAKTNPKRVFDESVTFIIRDILRDAVENGTGKNARIYSQPVAGKTGTTSDQYDIWFAGFTPKYSMALWEGADIHFELGDSSESVSSFWGQIMSKISEGDSYKNFPEAPDDVIRINGEYYVRGTK